MTALDHVKQSNLYAVAWHLERGKDNGGVSREVLAAFLRGVASSFGPPVITPTLSPTLELISKGAKN